MPKLVERALTAVAVDKLRPQEQRYDVFDGAVRGFGIRIAPSGTKTWFVMRRVNGKQTRATIGNYPGKSLSDARSEASILLDKMRHGITPERAAGTSVEAAVDDWLRRDQAGNRSFSEVERSMRLDVIPVIGARDITTIKRRDINELLDGIVDRGAPVEANRVFSRLRRLFRWSSQRDLIDTNPMLGMEPPSQERSRDRTLSKAELVKVWNACETMNYPFGPLIRLLILTSQRLNEVAEAEWAEFDLDGRKWIIPAERAKNKTPHLVHLAPTAIDIIRALPRRAGVPWLFSTTIKTPVSGFSRAQRIIIRESGVTGWTFHDIRRTFATLGTEELNISPVVIDKIQNHVAASVRGVARVYQRGQYLPQRQQALETWACYVERLVNESVSAKLVELRRAP